MSAVKLEAGQVWNERLILAVSPVLITWRWGNKKRKHLSSPYEFEDWIERAGAQLQPNAARAAGGK
jgi:hypothetical protein